MFFLQFWEGALLHKLIIPRRSRRDIVLASCIHSVHPSVHTSCLSGTISQYLLVRFDSFLVQMISTRDSRYPISLVKIDPLTLELLPLCWYRQLFSFFGDDLHISSKLLNLTTSYCKISTFTKNAILSYFNAM